jgi:uncharacterized protein
MRTSNRPWPTPTESWVMVQKWQNLLFAHWPIPFETLRPLVPSVLPLDTYDGTAWLGITPFVLRGLRSRGLPPIPGLSEFPEINVRTYVTLGGKPGVYFFSLDAASRAAVIGARLTFGLPYFFSRARVDPISDAFDYRSTRDDLRGHAATFRAQYRAARNTFHAEPGTLEYFLTERYALYTVGKLGKVWRAEIDHEPWPLQVAQAEIRTNTMASAADIPLPNREPLLHFGRFVDVRVWRPKRVGEDELLITRSH